MILVLVSVYSYFIGGTGFTVSSYFIVVLVLLSVYSYFIGGTGFTVSSLGYWFYCQ